MISYNGRFTLNVPARVLLDDDRLVDELMEALADYSVAVGSTAGRVDVTITYGARDLNQAISTGLAVVRAAVAPLGLQVVAAEVLTLWGDVPIPELVSVTEAAKMLKVSDARVRQLLDAGELPGVKVGGTWVLPWAGVEERAQRRAMVAARSEPRERSRARAVAAS